MKNVRQQFAAARLSQATTKLGNRNCFSPARNAKI
jgi:hypothetical protein